MTTNEVHVEFYKLRLKAAHFAAIATERSADLHYKVCDEYGTDLPPAAAHSLDEAAGEAERAELWAALANSYANSEQLANTKYAVQEAGHCQRRLSEITL